jgi:hypothetical protein
VTPLQHSLVSVVSVRASGLDAGLEQFLDGTADAVSDSRPFSQVRVDAAADFGQRLSRDPSLRGDVAATALAFWLRRGHLEQLSATASHQVPGEVRVPVGRVFHIAPSNVDTLFLYSWVVAFLAGNFNVVRLSRAAGELAARLLDHLSATFEDFPKLGAENVFITYGHDDEVTSACSQWCTCRIVWGGSDTVAAIRKVELNPHAVERVFPTKFSYGVFNASSYLAADTRHVDQNLFGDIVMFDQATCASPHLIAWIGRQTEYSAAVEKVARGLSAVAVRRGYEIDASIPLYRLGRAFEYVAKSEGRCEIRDEYPPFLHIREPDSAGLNRVTCGGGLIRHVRFDTLTQVAELARPEDQTIVHFGFGREELVRFAAAAGARGVDRVVRVGAALAFEPLWDGEDLIHVVTRSVRVSG